MNGSTVMREQNFQCAGLQHLEHANGDLVTWWGNRLPLYSLGMLSHICIHNWLLVRPNDAYLQQTRRCPVYLSFQLLQMVVNFQSKPTRMSAQAPSSTLTVLCWNWLHCGFNRDAVTYLCEHIHGDNPDEIVSESWEATSWAAKSMLNGDIPLCNADWQHLWKLPCAMWTHVLIEVELQASGMHLSLYPSPWLAADCWTFSLSMCYPPQADLAFSGYWSSVWCWLCCLLDTLCMWNMSYLKQLM